MLTPALRDASTSVATSASFGCGERSAGPSLRRTPSSRRTSFSASRAAALRAANSSFVPSLRSSSRYGAVSAWTAIRDMWWATTSCISRAMRVRSSSSAR